MRTLLLLTCLCLALIAAGCGGGGGNTVSTSGQDGGFGPFLTRAQGGTPQVITTSGGGPTVTAVVGTAFTKIMYNPPASLFNTRIAYTRGTFGTFNSINLCWLDGSGDHAIPHVFGAFGKLSWSRDGR